MSVRRSFTALLMPTLVASLACSQTVTVPLGDIEKRTTEDGVVVVTTKGGEAYSARSLSVEDSTLVIESLARDDPSHERSPIIIPLAQVASITEQQLRRGPTALAIGAGVLVIALIIYLGSYEASSFY